MISNLIRKKEIEIYKVAAFFFNKYGYPKTSIRQICKQIGIRESSIYHYISGKEDLLYNICKWNMYSTTANIEPIANRRNEPHLKLKKMIKAHIDFITSSSDEGQTMIKEMRYLSDPRREEIIKLRNNYQLIFEKTIIECIRKKYFLNLNAKLAAVALLGMMNSITRWYSVEGKYSKKYIAELFTKIFLNGVLKNGNIGI